MSIESQLPAPVQSKPPGRGEHDNNFNLLRLLLATTVLFTHTYMFVYAFHPPDLLNRLTGGQVEFSRLAVNGFFTISGYLVAQSWLRRPSAWIYLRKRVARIYPAFLVAGVLCACVLEPLTAGWGLYYSRVNIVRVLLNLSLLLYRAPAVALLQHGIYLSFHGAIWTVQLEFVCYLVLLALGVVGALRRRAVVLALFAGVTLFYCAQLAGIISVTRFSISYLLPNSDSLPRCLMFFLAGVCALLFSDRIRYTAPIAVLAAIAFLAVLAVPKAIEPVHAIAGSYLILAAAFARVAVLDRFKTMADISYGTYIYGWPIQFLLAFHFPRIGFLTHLALSCLGALTAGYLSWHLVEKWFLPRRRRKAQSAEW